ncbi:MAG: 2OG-Fe(II) oxygenase [Acidithiobacillus sp.]
MEYIDTAVMESLLAQRDAFQQKQPYPYASIEGFLREEAFTALCRESPSPEEMELENRRRAHGQQTHQRLSLQVVPATEGRLSSHWRNFLGELRGPVYLDFWRQMLGLPRRRPVLLSMHWHYAAAGASVSPHTDARRKLGSHIFYLNTPADWQEEWGGQTLVLDDGGRFPRHSAPTYDDLQLVAASTVLGNRSFLFAQTDHSWHAVRELRSPPGHLRKVFIVVANRLSFQVLSRRLRGKDPDGFRLR